MPSDGCLTFTEENREVFVAGFGPDGHAVGDVPRVLSKAVKGASVSLLTLFKGKKETPRQWKHNSKFTFSEKKNELLL